MGRLIIGVPSMAQKPSSEILADGWRQAIEEGLEKNEGRSRVDLAFKLAYYSDIYYPEPLTGDQEPYIQAAPGKLRRHKSNLVDRIRAKAGAFSLGRGILDGFAESILKKVLTDLARDRKSARFKQRKDTGLLKLNKGAYSRGIPIISQNRRL